MIKTFKDFYEQTLPPRMLVCLDIVNNFDRDNFCGFFTKMKTHSDEEYVLNFKKYYEKYKNYKVISIKYNKYQHHYTLFLQPNNKEI